MKSATLHIVVIAVVIFAFPQQAFSQIVDFLTSPGYSTMINNMISNNIWNRSMDVYMKNRNKEKPGAAKTKPDGKPSVYEVPAYRRYPAVRFKSTGTRLTLQEYLNSVNVGPKDKAELKLLIETMWDVYETEAARKGYPNDLALALVACVELNSHVYNGRTGKLALPFGQNLGVRDTVAKYAAGNGTFDKLTDRQKQELYELFVMLGGLTYHLYEKARKENNADELRSTKLGAAQNLKLLGIKL